MWGGGLIEGWVKNLDMGDSSRKRFFFEQTRPLQHVFDVSEAVGEVAGYMG